MVKKNFIFLLVSVSFLSLAGLALADVITLPNPLYVNSFQALIVNITNYIFGVVGALATLMFIWAGILFVVSGGNPGKIDQAKKTAIYAAVGAAIAIAGSGLIALINYIISG